MLNPDQPATPDKHPFDTSIPTWAPMRHRIFFWLWVGSLASNIGTWMQNIGATWLMTSLNPKPSMVSLVQTANFLPIFLLGLPAGALADLLDRRRLLIFTQTWMLIAAAVLAALTWAGIISDWILLLLTFMLGIGAALNAPGWQAIIPEMVEPRELAAAVALGSASFNAARAIGPALGGWTVAWAGPAFNFMLNAVSFLAVIVVLYSWERNEAQDQGPPERLLGAMISGLRYVRHSPVLHRLIARALVFVVPASALWALLPVVTHDVLKRGADIYGTLLGCLGAGAVLGTITLGALRRRLSIDALDWWMTALFAGATLSTACIHSVIWIGIALLFGGAAWLSLLSTLNASVQTSVPEWVRARALSIYLVLFFGGMAVSSPVWGAIANWIGTPKTLTLAAASGIASLLAIQPFMKEKERERIGLRPSRHLAIPKLLKPPRPDDHG